MATLKVVLTIIYAIICIALTIVVLMQEGKSAGLTGAISGVADTYWGKNKGRSMEGKMEKGTKILAVSFILLSIVLNLNLNW
ncbi:preprotein translocase subunit SecG [Anaerosporobacter sp.]